MDGVMARYNHVAAWPAGPKQPIFADYASASSSHNTDAKPGNSFEPRANKDGTNSSKLSAVLQTSNTSSKPRPADLAIQQSLARVQRQLADLTAATHKQLQLSPATNSFYPPPPHLPAAAAAAAPAVIPVIGPGVRPKPGEVVPLPGNRQALANVPPKRIQDLPARSRYMADLSPASRYPSSFHPEPTSSIAPLPQGQGQKQTAAAGSDVSKKQQQQQQGSKVTQQPTFAITNTAPYSRPSVAATAASTGAPNGFMGSGSQERSNNALVRIPTYIAPGGPMGNQNDEEHYMRLINDIVSVLSPVEYYASSPAKLLDYLFIGGYRDAEDVAKLRRMGITHVFNCAPLRSRGTVQSPYPPSSGIIAYDQVNAEDEESYDILQHFDKARQFVDRSKFARGRCLVHCAMGVNRSGALCAAYIIADQRMKLLDVVRLMKQRRGIVLCNRGFQRLLIRFARQRGLL